MSALDRVRTKFKVPTQGTSATSKSPSAGSAGSSPAHIEVETTPSAASAGASHTHIHSSESDTAFPLSPAQEAARRQVLAELKGHPTVRRAFCTRFEDGALIVTLAIRDVGTCDLLIPAGRFDSSKPNDYAALLGCLAVAGQ
jgi:hypothetical protein